MPEGDPCYFCEIANGNSHQWQIIEEDVLTLTLLNGRQFEIGQCVAIPRRHAPSLLDLKNESSVSHPQEITLIRQEFKLLIQSS